MKKIIFLLIFIPSIGLSQKTYDSLYQIIKIENNSTKIGAIDIKGQIIIEPDTGYDYVGQFYEGMARVEINNEYGYINNRWELVIPIKFDFTEKFSEGLAIITLKDQRIGAINKKGDLIIPPDNYFTLNSFSDGLAIFQKINGKGQGAINKNGDIVVPPNFENINNFSQNRAIVEQNRNYGVIDKSGNYIVVPDSKYESIWDYTEGLAMFKQNGKYGFFDLNGEVKIKPKYDGAGTFKEGLAYVRIDNMYGYIDTNGSFIIQPKLEYASNFKNGFAKMKKGNNYGFINQKGEFVIPANFKFVRDFSDGLAAINLDDKWGYINKSGKIVIEPQFKSVKPFLRGLAAVRSFDGSFVYINKKGEMIFNISQSKPFNLKNNSNSKLSNVSANSNIIGKWKLSDQNFIVDYSETNFSAKNLENGNVQKGTYILENDILIENQNGVEKVYRVNLTSNSLKIHPISNKEKIFTFNRVKETKNIVKKTPWAQTTTKPLFNNNLGLNEFIELLKSKIIFEIDQNLKNKLKGKQRIFVNVTVTSDKRFVDIMTRSVSQELKNIVEDLIKQQQIYSEGKKDGVSVNTLISFPISLNFN